MQSFCNSSCAFSPCISNFENGNSQFLDRGVFDPNFENAHNEFLGKRFYTDQTYILREKEFNEPMDGIVYGVTASLGFATLENIDFLKLNNSQ